MSHGLFPGVTAARDLGHLKARLSSTLRSVAHSLRRPLAPPHGRAPQSGVALFERAYPKSECSGRPGAVVRLLGMQKSHSIASTGETSHQANPSSGGWRTASGTEDRLEAISREHSGDGRQPLLADDNVCTSDTTSPTAGHSLGSKGANASVHGQERSDLSSLPPLGRPLPPGLWSSDLQRALQSTKPRWRCLPSPLL